VPRFYLNLRDRDRLFVDPEGDDLASADAAQGHALETARDLITRARMASIQNWFECSFEVTNEAGQVVLVLPFSETVKENEATREPGADQGVISEADARFEHRRPSHLLLQCNEAAQKRFALMLTVCLKLLKKALLERVRTGPALQLPTRFVVGGVDVSRRPKHLVLGGREVDGVGPHIVRRHRSGEGRSSWHQRSPGHPRSAVPLAPNRVARVARPQAAQSSGAEQSAGAALRAAAETPVWCAMNR
jgi:hypothetical protein